MRSSNSSSGNSSSSSSSVVVVVAVIVVVVGVGVGVGVVVVVVVVVTTEHVLRSHRTVYKIKPETLVVDSDHTELRDAVLIAGWQL